MITNPFNASRAVSPHCKVSELRTELKHRELPLNGAKAQLIERIETHNKRVRSIEGSREIHHRKFHDLKQEALKNVIPFPYFSKLPIEIRLMIWKLSLPGPRVLSRASHQLRDKMIFHDEIN